MVRCSSSATRAEGEKGDALPEQVRKVHRRWRPPALPTSKNVCSITHSSAVPLGDPQHPWPGPADGRRLITRAQINGAAGGNRRATAPAVPRL